MTAQEGKTAIIPEEEYSRLVTLIGKGMREGENKTEVMKILEKYDPMMD